MFSIKDQPLILKDFDSTYIYKYSKQLALLTNDAFCLLNETEKGLTMFKEKFVADIRFQETEERGYSLSFKVRAEMRKNVNYSVGIVLSETNEVQSCSCSCPAGQVPASCKHIFAALHALVDYSSKELYLSSTERIQAWHRPKPVKVSPMPFKEVFGKKNPLVARRKLNYAALFSGSQPLQFLTVLRDSSILAEEFSIPLPACILSKRPQSQFNFLNFEEFLFLNEHLKFNLEDIWEIEHQTRDQSQCAKWKNERRYRLTSSNFFNICRRTTDEKSYAQKLISPIDISNIPPVKYGIENESFVQMVVREAYPRHNLRKTGLVSNPFFPHLGASPDGLLFSKDSTLLLEIKCMYNKENKDLEDLAKNSSFCLEKNGAEWVLKKNHKYYYQVQGQLALSNLKQCLFALYYKRPAYIKMCVVNYDEIFWNNVHPKLLTFYLEHYLPLLMEKTN